VEQLLLRFATPELAAEFKDAFDEAKEQTARGDSAELGARPGLMSGALLPGLEEAKPVDDSRRSPDTDNRRGSDPDNRRGSDPESRRGPDVDNRSGPDTDVRRNSDLRVSEMPRRGRGSVSPETRGDPQNTAMACETPLPTLARARSAGGRNKAGLRDEDKSSSKRDAARAQMREQTENVELYSQRATLYRYRELAWRERGVGEAKLLKHKETGKVRFVIRDENTLKVIGNHYIVSKAPYCELRSEAGNGNGWVWSALDYSEGRPRLEQLALKFESRQLASEFRAIFDKTKEMMASATGNVTIPDAEAEKNSTQENFEHEPAQELVQDSPEIEETRVSATGWVLTVKVGRRRGTATMRGIWSRSRSARAPRCKRSQ